MLGAGYGRRGYRRSDMRVGSVTVDDMSADGDALASLVSTWSEVAASTGWVWPGDWWHPSVEAAAAAVLNGVDAGPALARLGDARARAGVGVAEALDDLEALFAAACGAEPPYGALRAYVEAYGDAALGTAEHDGCEDPLTGLATMPYLRARVVEEYREAARDGALVARRAALVVVEISPDSGPALLATIEMIKVADVLRSVFSGGETCAALSRRRSAALVRRRETLPRSVQLLQELLAARSVNGATARSWVEGLPPHESGAVALLDELAR